MAKVIELDNLLVRLGGRVILDRLAASLSGKCIGLLGPNGSGKSTLINTMLGFYPPEGGTLRIFGKDVQRNLRELRAQIGYMPESDAFIADMTGVRFVRYMSQISGLPSRYPIDRPYHSTFYFLLLL